MNLRSIRVTEIPLHFSEDDLHNHFSTYGSISRLSLDTKGIWQVAVITFDRADSIMGFYESWGTILFKHLLRVYPLDLPNDQYELRKKFIVKLTGLPRGTTVIDLLDIIDAVQAKTCVIPKTGGNYTNRPFAYLTFASESDLNEALKTSYALANRS